MMLAAGMRSGPVVTTGTVWVTSASSAASSQIRHGYAYWKFGQSVYFVVRVE